MGKWPAALVLVLALAGCSSSSSTDTVTVTTATPSPSSPSVAGDPTVVRTVATDLDVPWGIAFLPDGSALVAERPTGEVVRLDGRGGVTKIGIVPGVRDDGEGGLLGLAFEPSTPAADDAGTLFAYLTSTAGDNRVVAIPYAGSSLGTPKPVLTGIASADHHNGGLVTIGPDGKLWIGTGDAGVTARAQDRASLNGKILRIDLDGTVPEDNPFPGSPVYSWGHRNVQGLAFDSAGQPWATEFGQNTWDELNRITPGGNYGWPVVEGRKAHAGFIEPLVQWHTDEASPSGIAIVDDVAYIGALRGQRLWEVPLHGTTVGTPKALFRGTFGRIRTVVKTLDGTLWITTSNRDGRGVPGPGDDKVVELRP